MATFFLQELGCAVIDLACPRAKSVNDLLEAQLRANVKMLAAEKWATYALIQRPTADGSLIPADFNMMVKAGTYNTNANIMWGTVHDEAGYFVVRYCRFSSNFHTVGSEVQCLVLTNYFIHVNPFQSIKQRARWNTSFLQTGQHK